MNEMCWDLNPNCRAQAEGEAKQPCPIGCYEQKKGCWEFNWKPLLKEAPKELIESVTEMIKENCTKCPVYDKHQEEIDETIKSIQSIMRSLSEAG